VSTEDARAFQADRLSIERRLDPENELRKIGVTVVPAPNFAKALQFSVR
jgi:hypothetical protein